MRGSSPGQRGASTASQSSRPPGPPRSWVWVTGALAPALVVSTFAFRQHVVDLGDRVAMTRLTPQKTTEAGYVSSSACRACHPHEYQTWHRSYHRSMTQEAGPVTAKGVFSGQVITTRGLSFRLRRDEDRFLVDQQHENGAVTHHRLSMITGSHHMQIYWAANSEGVRTALPVAFLFQDQRWAPVMDIFINDPGMGDWNLPVWDTACVRCHSTGALPRGGVATRVGELGIACEACHGPGEAHVRANRNPLRRYAARLAGKDSTIVNPEHLDARAASEICGACHGVRWFQDSLDYMRNGARFHPGDTDDPTHPLVRPRHLSEPSWLAQAIDQESPTLLDDHFWSDGMVRVSGREYNGVRESPCFAGGRFSCLSCHSLHDSEPNDQLRREPEEEPCLACHARLRGASASTAHSHHRNGSTGNACLNCHMPYTTYGLLKSIRSHQVSIPSVKESVDVGRPNACNLCHLDRTLAWTDDALARWFGTRRVPLSADERRVAASILWLLEGDAGQRAIVADAMGRTSARDASGADWLAPLLSQLLVDPYSAVRYVAFRSLRSLPGYASMDYDYTAPPPLREAARREALARRRTALATRPELLQLGDGLWADELQRLLEQRDDRPVSLKE